MANATPRKFAIQQVFEILLQDSANNNQILAYLTDCKTSGLENTLEMVYPTGGRGNVYVGRGFSHSRRAKLNVEMATWNTQVVAAQNGTSVVVGATPIVQYDVLPVTNNAAATTQTAIGTVGSEIGFCYLQLSDGTYGKVFTQTSGTPTTGTFTYDSATKALTFFAGDIATGENVCCAYQYTSGATAQNIAITASGIPAIVNVTAFGLVADVCSGELFPCQITGRAQVDGNWNWDLSADGDPAVQALGMEFVRTYTSQDLYNIKVYTEEI